MKNKEDREHIYGGSKDWRGVARSPELQGMPKEENLCTKLARGCTRNARRRPNHLDRFFIGFDGKEQAEISANPIVLPITIFNARHRVEWVK